MESQADARRGPARRCRAAAWTNETTYLRRQHAHGLRWRGHGRATRPLGEGYPSRSVTCWHAFHRRQGERHHHVGALQSGWPIAQRRVRTRKTTQMKALHTNGTTSSEPRRGCRARNTAVAEGAYSVASSDPCAMPDREWRTQDSRELECRRIQCSPPHAHEYVSGAGFCQRFGESSGVP
jgi:hypothetical protein